MNVGREQVHVVESGPPDGVPLLLTSGLGGAWFDWAPAVALLRDRYRVTVFDRPGLGLSPAAAARPTLRRDTAILAALAERAGPPVIVLAHSMAAFHAEALARLRPGLVRGMVLADPSHERGPRADVRLAAALTPLVAAAGAVLGATRLARVAGPLGRRLRPPPDQPRRRGRPGRRRPLGLRARNRHRDGRRGRARPTGRRRPTWRGCAGGGRSRPSRWWS